MRKVKVTIVVEKEMTNLQIKALEKPFNLDAYIKNVILRYDINHSSIICTMETKTTEDEFIDYSALEMWLTPGPLETENEKQDRLYNDDVEEMQSGW